MNEEFVEEVVRIYMKDGVPGIFGKLPDIDKMKFKDKDEIRGEFTITLNMKDIFLLALIYFGKKYADKIGEKMVEWTLSRLAEFLREEKASLLEFFDNTGFEKKEELAEELVKGIEEASKRGQN